MSDTVRSTVKLSVALAATWLMLAIAGFLVEGAAAIEALTYAAILCLMPHAVCVVYMFVIEPQSHPLADVLVTMAVRLVVTLGGAALLCWHRPDMRSAVFIVSLAVCYFVALAVETRLQVLKARSSRPEPVNGSSISTTPIGS